MDLPIKHNFSFARLGVRTSMGSGLNTPEFTLHTEGIAGVDFAIFPNQINDRFFFGQSMTLGTSFEAIEGPSLLVSHTSSLATRLTDDVYLRSEFGTDIEISPESFALHQGAAFNHVSVSALWRPQPGAVNYEVGLEYTQPAQGLGDNFPIENANQQSHLMLQITISKDLSQYL